MPSKQELVNIGRVLIDIIAIAVKARMGFYGKDPMVAIVDIKNLVDAVIDASGSIKNNNEDNVSK